MLIESALRASELRCSIDASPLLTSKRSRSVRCGGHACSNVRGISTKYVRLRSEHVLRIVALLRRGANARVASSANVHPSSAGNDQADDTVEPQIAQQHRLRFEQARDVRNAHRVLTEHHGRLGELRVATFGAPRYFAKHGRPKHSTDLVRHQCIVRSSDPEAELRSRKARARARRWSVSHGGCSRRTERGRRRFRHRDGAALARSAAGLGAARGGHPRGGEVPRRCDAFRRVVRGLLPLLAAVLESGRTSAESLRKRSRIGQFDLECYARCKTARIASHSVKVCLSDGHKCTSDLGRPCHLI